MKLLSQIQNLEFPAPLPDSLLVVKQDFDAPVVEDIGSAVEQAFVESGLLAKIQPGASVAVGVGSRGIANLATIVRSVIEKLQGVAAEPYVIPAMGSHGGATAEGQIAVLTELGVTSEAIGAPIRATMETRPIGQIPDGLTLFQDVLSADADHTILIGRIKPHTDFHGDLESGLAKMAVIGLGKQRGAIAMHAYGVAGFQRFLAPAARIYEEKTNLLGGLAILENAYHDTAQITGLTAREIGGDKEMELLKLARTFMARLPFANIDVLVLRYIGKNVSGTGMDTNVVGRLMIPRQPEDFGDTDIAVIAMMDLTEESGGNANGMGLANVTTARFARKIDWAATYTNAITSGIFGMQRVNLPIVAANDRIALQMAVLGCGQQPEEAGMVFIRDTLSLGQVWVSPGFGNAIETDPRLSIVGEVPLRFNAAGQMVSPWNLDDTLP